MQLEKKTFILRVWSLMHEQSEGNNHTSKWMFFPCSTWFFFLRGSKMDLFAPHEAIKSTLWPVSRKRELNDKHFMITLLNCNPLDLNPRNATHKSARNGFFFHIRESFSKNQWYFIRKQWNFHRNNSIKFFKRLSTTDYFSNIYQI